MPFITWTESFSVNVPEMDAQHKRLVELINQLHDAMAKRQGKEILQPLFSGLIQYAATHFAAEEKFLQQQQSPDLAHQISAHQNFTKTVQDLKQRYDSGQTLLSIETMTFMKDWLTKHVMGTDKKYAPRAVPAGTS